MDEQQKSSQLLIPGSIILAGVLIAGAVIYSGKLGAPTAEKSGGTAALTEAGNTPVAGDLSDDDPSLGNPDAPVTIVEFSDFECPFCGRFFHTVLPEIKEKYVKTGKARFIYRDFPLSTIHTMAEKAAEAGECADEQGKFWPYHDVIFERQQQLSVANLKAWAVELGLNASQFNNCLDSGKYSDEIEKDIRDGESAGVRGTPGTFVNGRMISGAVPFEQFAAIIEEELKK